MSVSGGLELLYKHLYMKGAYLRQPEVPQNGQDVLLDHPFVGGAGDRGKHLGDNLHILGAEVAEAYSARVQIFAVFDAGFKDNGESVDFFFNLPGRHARNRPVCFGFTYLFPIGVIAAGNRDPITAAAFLDTRHNTSPFLYM